MKIPVNECGQPQQTSPIAPVHGATTWQV